MSIVAYGVESIGGVIEFDQRGFATMAEAASFAGAYLGETHRHGEKGSVTVWPIDSVDGPSETEGIVMVCPHCAEASRDVEWEHEEAMNVSGDCRCGNCGASALMADLLTS
jgi:hypothetical protein